MTDCDCNALLNEIIAIELKMFQSVNNEGGKADCQDQPEAFWAMRHMTYSVLSPQVLEACLDDLKKAESVGRNFMTEKYALMCGRIEMPSISPLIKGIIACELAWLQAAEKEQPNFFGGNDNDFCRYLLCELLPYSEATLKAYAQGLAAAKSEGRNLALERMDILKNMLRSTPARPACVQ